MKFIKNLLFLVLFPTLLFAQKKPDSIQIDSLKKVYPVILKGDTLLSFQNQLGSLTAKERAERTRNKLVEIENNLIVKTDSIKILQLDDNTEVLYNDEIIFSLSKADADSLKTTTTDLAEKYRARIVQYILANNKEVDTVEILKRTGLGLLVLLILSFIIYIINKFSSRFLDFLTLKLLSNIKAIKIKEYELITKTRAISIFRRTFNVFKTILILLLIYLTLPILFRIFPWSRGWGDHLLNFILNPLENIFTSVVNFIPNLITILVIVLVFRYINKVFKFLSREIENGKLEIKGFYADWAMPTYNIIKVIIYAFMLVVIWPFIPGSNSDIFKGVSVFLGILISLGSSTAISNIVAGLVITYMRPFKIGDRVKIGDITGDVVEKAFLVTRIKTVKHEIITIPNSAILNGNTVNYSSAADNEGLIMHTTVTIGYDVPHKKVHEMLIEAAKRCELLMEDKEPFVLQTSLDDFYVSYELNVYTAHEHRMSAIYSIIHQEIQNVFNENGVEIMSPHYKAMRDGNETTIPSAYRAEDYEAPAFKVKEDKAKK
ncbi:mechanosensitive ion channel family protein [Pedobacter sp. MW01-1-1]|uniref:mechanosensitive ion channel family protein n=1 Tax=Pedobacter sp. MW01-1-1 TaxID=3383027 RepID=UPI003FEF79D5